jgi:A-macroglobulin TED domain
MFVNRSSTAEAKDVFTSSAVAFALNYLSTTKSFDFGGFFLFGHHFTRTMLTPQLQSSGLEIAKKSYQHIVKQESYENIKSACMTAKFLIFVQGWFEIKLSLISKVFLFFASQQADNGYFVEQKSDQRSLTEIVSLTALVTIAIRESEMHRDDYVEVTNHANKFVAGSINFIDDDYTLAISAYATFLVNKADTDKFLEKLIKKAIDTGHEMYWNVADASKGIETAAYATLVCVKMDKYFEATKIMKWLGNQPEAHHSKMSKIITFQAATEFSKIMLYQTSNFNLNLTFGPDNSQKINVNLLNKKQIQTVTIHGDQDITIKASGKGVAFVRFQKKVFIRK